METERRRATQLAQPPNKNAGRRVRHVRQTKSPASRTRLPGKIQSQPAITPLYEQRGGCCVNRSRCALPDRGRSLRAVQWPSVRDLFPLVHRNHRVNSSSAIIMTSGNCKVCYDSRVTRALPPRAR